MLDPKSPEVERVMYPQLQEGETAELLVLFLKVVQLLRAGDQQKSEGYLEDG